MIQARATPQRDVAPIRNHPILDLFFSLAFGTKAK